MARRTPALPLPTVSAGFNANIRAVNQILDEAEEGCFYNAARLVTRCMRDDRIYSTVTTRVLALLGKHLDFEPSKGPKSGEARGRKIAEEIESEWPSMFARSALVQLKTWGIMLGLGYGQIIERSDGWSLETWNPGNLEWDPWKRVFTIQARDERFSLTEDRGLYVDTRGRRWLVYTPYGVDAVGSAGLISKLGSLYIRRLESLDDRSRYSEVNGQPMRVGIAPVNATQAQINDYSDAIAPAGAETVVVARQGEPGNVWDLKLIESTGRSHELFRETIAQLDKAIADTVLGQSQSTDGQAGLGSNAEAGEPIRLDIMRADADTLSDALRAQFLVPYCDFTYGSGELAPWPCWQVDPPEDEAALAKVRLDMANADKIYIEAGVLLPERVAIDRFGDEFTLETRLSEEEVAMREKILSIGHEQMEVEAEKALEDAKNPPEPPVMQPNGAANGVAVPDPSAQENGDQPSPQASA